MLKPIPLALVAFLSLAALARGAAPSSRPAAVPQAARHEEMAIRKLASKWQEDWNRHDAKALAAMATGDIDFVTAEGNWLMGRDALESWLSQTTFKNSVWKNDQVIIRFLMPDIAVVHITWAIGGVQSSNGSAAKSGPGITTWVLIKAGGRWIIRDGQSTYAPAALPHP
jgi:uncharacterized protein (TIGR02246 family)